MPRIAACHVAPIYLDPAATTQKILNLIAEAAQNQADLVAFPESYLPGFPVWLALSSPIRNHDLFKQFAAASVYIDGPELTKIRAVAKSNKIWLSLGISEKTHTSTACLYNANVLISPDGEIVVHHRKLVPTFYEKLVWASGDGHGLRVIDTHSELGKIGALICGENTNSLARYAMISQGEQIHIACFPPIWPTRPVTSSPSSPSSSTTMATGEKGEEQAIEKKKKVPKNYDNVKANLTRAAAHSFEMKGYTIVVSAFFSERCKQWMISQLSTPLHSSSSTTAASSTTSSKGREEGEEEGGRMAELETLLNSQQSATLVTDPSGSLYSEIHQHQESILYSDLDLDDGVEGKQYHDVSGGYQRPDVFGFVVDRRRRENVTFIE